MLTLWDLIPKRRGRGGGGSPTAAPITTQAPPPRPERSVRIAPASPGRARGAGARERYEAMTRAMLDEYGVRVRKWRSSMSGVAWEVHYQDGRLVRLIESPRPRGPVSASIFLHEIGHHAIGFNRYRPRCLEEYHAWRWSLERMDQFGFTITKRVEDRVRDSLRYAVWKAQRRGLKRIPAELLPYLADPPVASRRAPATPPRLPQRVEISGSNDSTSASSASTSSGAVSKLHISRASDQAGSPKR